MFHRKYETKMIQKIEKYKNNNKITPFDIKFCYSVFCYSNNKYRCLSVGSSVCLLYDSIASPLPQMLCLSQSPRHIIINNRWQPITSSHLEATTTSIIYSLRQVYHNEIVHFEKHILTNPVTVSGKHLNQSIWASAKIRVAKERVWNDFPSSSILTHQMHLCGSIHD